MTNSVIFLPIFIIIKTSFAFIKEKLLTFVGFVLYISKKGAIMKKRPLYLDKLIDFKDQDVIKVITGIRRCGKSSLLELFAKHLKSNGVSEKNILQINFESLQYGNMTYQELYDFVKQKVSEIKGKFYLLFDEIQKIAQWELAINSIKVDLDVDIYITGSNAYLLSSQLSTYLSGRYVEIKMRPLSFKEFLDFSTFENDLKIEEKFDLYLKFGGMPGLSTLNFNEQMIYQMLEGIFSTVIMKDVIEQAEVRDPALLRKITRFLADNIGNNTSGNKIKNTLISENSIEKKTTTGTVDNYIMLLGNAYVFYNIARYDIKGKEYLKTQGKYYMVDMGLRNFLLGYRNMDRGHILENVVFLELLNRGYNVSIGKIENKEIDFIATTTQEKIYIQASETLNSEETRNREIAPLTMVKDNFEKIILTTDVLFKNINENGIKIINIIDWLLK